MRDGFGLEGVLVGIRGGDGCVLGVDKVCVRG